MEKIKVIDLLNKIANGELKDGTRFIDKYTKTEYIFKPNSYAGIYPPNEANADKNWLLSLGGGCFRLDQEVEILEEDKKIEKIDKDDLVIGTPNGARVSFTLADSILLDKINEIIDVLNKEK